MQIVACRDGLLDLCNSGNQFRRPVFKSEAPLVYFGRLASRFCHVREFKVGHEIAFHHELSGAHGTHIAIGCRVHVHPDLPICRDPPVCFVVLDQLPQQLCFFLLALLREEGDHFGAVLPHLAPHLAALGGWHRLGLLLAHRAHDGRKQRARVHRVHDLEVCKAIALAPSLRLALSVLGVFMLLKDDCQGRVRAACARAGERDTGGQRGRARACAHTSAGEAGRCTAA